MSRVSLKPASVSRAFVVLLFFSRRLNVTCAGGERKKVYLYATNSLLIATAQFLDTLALQYARVLIKRISFVVLVVVTEERTEALNYHSTQIMHKIAGAERRFRGGKSVSLNLINYTRGKRNRTPPHERTPIAIFYLKNVHHLPRHKTRAENGIPRDAKETFDAGNGSKIILRNEFVTNRDERIRGNIFHPTRELGDGRTGNDVQRDPCNCLVHRRRAVRVVGKERVQNLPGSDG